MRRITFLPLWYVSLPDVTFIEAARDEAHLRALHPELLAFLPVTED